MDDAGLDRGLDGGFDGGFDGALERAHARAREWLAGLGDRPVPAPASVAEVVAALGELPEKPADPVATVDLLARACEPGLVGIPSGRFFGFVIGGSLPAALAADWLVSAWDQNSGLRMLTPAHSAVEDVASAWLLRVLGLPPESAVGFVTGATMANFTCLAAARDQVLRDAGWDVAERGLHGGPRVRVLVGAERHDSVDTVLRYLGLGRPEPVAADSEGRIRPDELAAALAEDPDVPTLVVLQAGNLHSGAFDPFAEAIAIAHEHGAWVHVDGAFGLWAAASPSYRPLLAGVADADSWCTDAHKTLNVPYDCGLAIVRDATALRSAMSIQGPYLLLSAEHEPLDKVPEMSRRGRAFTVWAAMHSLGASGMGDLVDRLAGAARHFARGLDQVPGAEVLHDVVFTQVCFSLGNDARTREVGRRVLEEGDVWISGSTWQDRAVLRVSFSNWSTTPEDVDRGVQAVRRAAAAADRA